MAVHPSRPLHYDALRRRLWIFGQRCHHGAGGALVTAVTCMRLLLAPRAAAGSSTMMALAAGGALMLHDWKDRAIWFERGPGSQP